MTLFGGSNEPRGPVKSKVLPGRKPLRSRNTQLIESPVVWLADKAADDQRRTGCPPHLWCVNGKLYDLADFAKRHPGGREWLDMTQGHDISELVEVHHFNMKAVGHVLAKCYVRDAPRAKDAAQQPRYTFDPKGFYCTLKRRATQVLGTSMKGHGPTAEMHSVAMTMLSAWLVCFAAMCLAPMYTAVVAAVMAATFLHALFGVGHNFFHQANNLWMYVFDLTLYTSNHWRVSHAISHHTYANLELDTEVSSVEPFMYFLTNKPRNAVTVYASFHLLLIFASTLDCIRHYVGILTLKESFRPEDCLVWIEALLLVWCRGVGPGLGLFFLMQCITSWMLAALSFSVHRTEHSWTEGDANPQLDFGRHIVLSTADHSVNSGLLKSFYCYAGLNYHILHHLFPTVDHSRLKQLDPVFRQTMKEFNIPYRTFTFRELFAGVFRRHDMAPIGNLIHAAPQD